MIQIHDDIEQGTQAWLDVRNGKYTGSNAWKLLRYGATAFAQASNQASVDTRWTRRGHALEPEAISVYEAIRHCHVDRPGYVTNDQFPDCLFSPDGLVNGTIVECKAFNPNKHLAIYHGDIPFEVMAQVQFGMMLCELTLAHLVIYNPDFAKEGKPKLAFKIIEIKANRNIANNFKRILGKETNVPA